MKLLEQAVKRTPYVVICKEHGQVFLTERAYLQQLNRPDAFWICPICADTASWDDENFEAFYLEEK